MRRSNLKLQDLSPTFVGRRVGSEVGEVEGRDVGTFNSRKFCKSIYSYSQNTISDLFVRNKL